MNTSQISQKELLAMYRDIESDRVEKTQQVDRDKICKTICALANDLPAHNKVGVLFIGQKDNGECANLPITDELLRKISNFNQSGDILPPPVITVQKHTFDSCPVSVVTVMPSTEPPVRYKGNCWVRVGPSQTKATPQQELHLSEKRQAKDETFMLKQIAIGFEELNLDYFKHQYLPVAISRETLAENNRSIEHQLQSLGFLSSNGYPNNAAILCFYNNPRQFIPGAYIQFVRFPGNDVTNTDGCIHQEIDGTIFEQMLSMDRLFNLHITTMADFSNTTRTDKPSYPILALNEILRNAVIHRRYEGTNAPIKCYWFSDRLEIHSPGGLYGQVNRHNFATELMPTDYRNLSLATAAKNTGYAEQFGVGILKAKKSLQQNNNPDLECTVTEDSVLIKLKPTTQ